MIYLNNYFIHNEIKLSKTPDCSKLVRQRLSVDGLLTYWVLVTWDYYFNVNKRK